MADCSDAPVRRAARHRGFRWLLILLLLPLLWAGGYVAAAPVAAPAAAVAAADPPFDLPAYRKLAASDRERGIQEGREALAKGVFAHAPQARMLLLWYMGGAAVGKPDDVALAEVIGHLQAMSDTPGASSLAGFLRGARQVDLGETGAGLITILQAANSIPDNDPKLRIISASELCRWYANAGMPQRALAHCQRHSKLVQASGDAVALARAQYLEASALSDVGRVRDAIPVWRASRDGFAAAGLETLAGRAADGLAVCLNEIGNHAEALTAARESVAIAKHSGNSISVSIAQGDEAIALLGLKRAQEALQVIEAALARMTEIDQPQVQHQLKTVQRDILVALGAPAAHLQQLDREIVAATGKDPEPQQADAISTLEQHHLQREQTMRIRELEQENQRRELDIVTAQQHIEAARQRTVALEQRAREQRQYMLLWGGVAVVLIVVVAAGAFVMRAQRKLATNLREQAYRDNLTKLPNRRALLERMHALEAGTEGSGGDALLMVDIDFFKNVNDARGHAAGDVVLAEVARALAACTPPGGTVGRLGGEEFLVIAPNHDQANARALGERLRAAVAALSVPIEGQTPLTVTVSVGIALRGGKTDYRRQTDWLAAADTAMYRAKENGRNRVELIGAIG